MAHLFPEAIRVLEYLLFYCNIASNLATPLYSMTWSGGATALLNLPLPSCHLLQRLMRYAQTSFLQCMAIAKSLAFC